MHTIHTHDPSAPLPLNRHEVPEGFVSGRENRLPARATVALTSMGALFLLAGIAALSVATLAANGLVGPVGSWLLPVASIAATVVGAGIAQYAWPRRGRIGWGRPLTLGVTAGSGVLGVGLLASGLLAV